MNQKLEEGKQNNKGLSLDPQKNNLQLHSYHQNHHQHNLNQTLDQILISRQPVEEEEDPNLEKQGQPNSFHGFHNQFFQQTQQLNQHQLLYRGGLDAQTSSLPPQGLKKRSYLPSSSKEYASLRGKMGDSSTQNQQTSASRLGNLRNTNSNIGGEIVEVQGGHIVRSTGRKDRHSKVCTAKGPRDRRVRLSAHTAIQFYDVQDRLGYDRPSKAVDWLIKKAKAAIDELEELPAWTPTSSIPIINQTNQDQSMQHHQLHQHHLDQQPPNDHNNNSSFLPASMDSDSIADTIKSFFPMSASDTNTSNVANVQFHQHNFQQLPRSTNQNQDLRLSLQSLQDPMLLHHQNQHEQTTGLFSGTHQMSSFDGSGWSENPNNEMNRLSRMVSWNTGGDTGGSGSGVEGGAFVFNSPPSSMQQHQQQQQQQSMYGQTQLLFSQRRPLQSSNTPSICAWIDPSTYDHHQAASSFPYHPSTLSGIGFASAGEFSGFRVPARIQGEEEEHDRVSDKPSSASSDSPQ